MELFLRHSQGHNRGLLTVSSELLNGSVYLSPWRSDKNSQRPYNMKQPSAGQSVARYFGSRKLCAQFRAFPKGLSNQRTDHIILKMDNYSSNKIKTASNTSAASFSAELLKVGFSTELLGGVFLGAHADWMFLFCQVVG